MKTCSALLVSLELQASSFFRLDVVCVHEACSVENATVVEIMGSNLLFFVWMSRESMIMWSCLIWIVHDSVTSLQLFSLSCKSLSSTRLMKTFSWCL